MGIFSASAYVASVDRIDVDALVDGGIKLVLLD